MVNYGFILDEEVKLGLKPVVFLVQEVDLGIEFLNDFRVLVLVILH